MRAEEARILARHGRDPALKTTRWRLLKRARNLAVHQSGNMRYPSPA